MATATILDRVVERTALHDHDGRSGASLERAVLDDGTRLIVKTSRPALDLVAQLTDGGERELDLWRGGHLDGLPNGVSHCILDGWTDRDATVTVMRDLGDAVVGWGRPVSLPDAERIIAAAAAVHAHFAGSGTPDLCPLEQRLVLLGPDTMRPHAAGSHPLPAAVLRGWELFLDLVPPDVAAGVQAVFDRPSDLADALRRSAPATLLHGDLWLVNLALEPDGVVLLDWGLATEGPAILDFTSFLVGNHSRLAATRGQLITRMRTAEGDLVTDASLHLGLLAGLVELGWNKALDIVEHPDAAIRARERADLDWWISAARPALWRHL